MSPHGTEHSAQALRMSAGGMIASSLVVAAIAVVLWTTFSLIAAAFVESPSIAGGESVDAAAGGDRLAIFVDQFNGRTMFFTPAEPPPAPVVRAPVTNSEPVAPSAPTRYGGPSIIGMANDTIWFSDKRQATVGGEAVGDLRVLSNKGAWHIVVEWQGVEFDVPFMTRDNLILPPIPESNRAGGDLDAEVATGPSGVSAEPEEDPSDQSEENEQEESGSREGSQPGDEN